MMQPVPRPTRLAACAAGLWLACPAVAFALDPAQQKERLLFESHLLEERIARLGQDYEDARLTAYLQSVVDGLYPTQLGRLRIHVVRDAETNAFALPSGALYINSGALLRIRNEAELAALLGHEGAHVTESHGLERAARDKSVATAASILGNGMLLSSSPGIAVSGYILADTVGLSSTAGFSRDAERAADSIGLAQLAAAGYDASAAATLFDRLRRELQARKIKESFYPFATHPRFEERVANAAATGQPPGRTGRDEYLEATRDVRRTMLEELRSRRMADALIFLLADEGMTDENSPVGDFMLGEAYRLRGGDGDAERARAQYLRSVERHPDYAPAWAALGRDYARTGDRAEAVRCFSRYLDLEPAPRDAAFVRQSLEHLQRETAP